MAGDVKPNAFPDYGKFLSMLKNRWNALRQQTFRHACETGGS